MSVRVCAWCLVPGAPDPLLHPNGQYEHVPANRVVKGWPDLAYEMWALLCTSTTDGHSSLADWTAARNRLGQQFIGKMGGLPTEADSLNRPPS